MIRFDLPCRFEIEFKLISLDVIFSVFGCYCWSELEIEFHIVFKKEIKK